MAVRFLVAFSFCNYLMQFTGAVPEPGIKDVVLSKDHKFLLFSKSLFKDAKIVISGETEKNTSELKLGWRLYKSECAQAFMQVKDDDKVPPDDYKSGSRLLSSGKHFNIAIHLTKTVESRRTDEVTTVETGNVEPAEQPNTRRHKREASRSSSRRSNRRSTKKQRKTNKPTTKKEKSKNKSTNKPEKSKNKPTNKPEKSKKNPTTEAGSTSTEKATTAGTRSSSTKASHVDNSQDGNYLLVIRVQNSHGKEFRLRVKVTMKSSTGYLSAAEWPLLPFYGAMSLVYLAYGVVWLIVSACQWRELLRIQFWIGGVIALGMLEKAILFSEYNNVNNFGTPAHGLVVFAQVLSCFKRTLSRILIIIVSMGFGIVKPRLGGALQRVLGVGCLYFILCVIEGSYREITFQADVNRKQLLAAVPLSVLDAVICWWIFMSLMQTMRTLRIRKNIVKLSLYRHFTNILVASVVVSVAFMIWVIRSQHFNTCIKDWKELWIDDAFWHFLFVLVLLAIMILWRPTANNQRYAFTPLIDVGDDGDDDMTLSDAFQGMKMRNKSEGEAPTRTEKTRNKVEDDLKWVEENIPTAGGGIDTALPTLLDSDEEVMTTKLEMSKME